MKSEAKGAETAGRLSDADVRNVVAMLLDHAVEVFRADAVAAGAGREQYVDVEHVIPDPDARRAFLRAMLLWDGAPGLLANVAEYPHVKYDLVATFLADLIRVPR